MVFLPPPQNPFDLDAYARPVFTMAEGMVKVASPVPVPANIPSLDGASESHEAAAQPSSPQNQRIVPQRQDGDGDTVMASPTMDRTAGAPPTPESSPKTSAAAPAPPGPVPLESPLRTTPIHPSLPSVKVPASAQSSDPNTNPITLRPFTEAELSKHGYEKLRAQIFAASEKQQHQRGGASAGEGALGDREKEEIQRVRDETAAALKHKIEEREAKVREIDREMEEKEKIREVERKVFRKKLAGGKEG